MNTFFEQFFLSSSVTEAQLIQGVHSPWLVVLSVFVAMVTSWMALQLAGVATGIAKGRFRLATLVVGGLALGTGVWSMHFIGMLAFDLCQPVRFEPVLTALSMVPSLVASTVALGVISRPDANRRTFLVGGVLVGSGIGVMHYAGMAAMQMDAVLRYDPPYFLLSLVVAVSLAVMALWVRARIAHDTSVPRWRGQLAGGAILGLAISGMHYTAMRAARFVGNTIPGYEASWTEQMGLALVIAIITLVTAGVSVGVITALRMRDIIRQLTSSEQRLKATLNTAVDGVISIDGRGTVLAFNPAAERIFGWSSAEVVGRNINMLMPEPYRSQHDGYLHNFHTTGQARIIGTGREVVALRKDGSTLPIRLALGQAGGAHERRYVGYVTDLTEQKRVEAALRESEAQHRSLIANIPGATFRIRMRGVVRGEDMVFVSEAIEGLTGWAPADFQNELVAYEHLIPAEDRQSVADERRSKLKDSGAYRIEYRIHSRDGRDKWVAETGSITKDAQGHPAWVDGIVMDITEVRLSHAEFEAVVSAIRRAQMVIEFSVDGHVLDVNDQFLTFSGYRFSELIGRPHSFLCSPSDVQSLAYQHMWAQLRSGQSIGGEFHRIGKGGQDLWIYATYHPIIGLDGKPSRIMKLVSDLSERRAMEMDLRSAKDRAEQAAAAKGTFLANMSHEIRTPMNAVIGFTDVLLESHLEPQQREHLAIVSRSARSLLGLLNDILDTAKLEQNAVELESTDFSLRDLCTELLDTHRLSAGHKGLTLALDYPSELPSYYKGDPTRVRQVLVNLLGNAVKFTEKGSVKVSVRDALQGVRLAVVDTGIGIAPDRLERIFDPFAQADASMTRRFGGTGLGTTIARQLVELMGGRIDVTSEPGVGSCFTVNLPLMPGQKPQPSTVHHVLTLPPLRVLVADDVPQNVQLLEWRLKVLGHTVTVAHDGEQALAIAQTGAFDLVLMDVQMPNLDGLEATRRLRQWEREQGQPCLPVIALTASVSHEDREACMNAEMNGFVVKPVNMGQLVAEMARVLDWDGNMALPSPVTAGTTQVPTQSSVSDGVDWAQGEALWGDIGTLRAQMREWTRQTLGQTVPAEATAQRALAHRIRGAAANLGLCRIADMAEFLERQAGAGAAETEAWLPLWAEIEALSVHLGEPLSAAVNTESTQAVVQWSADDWVRLLHWGNGLSRGELMDEAMAALGPKLPKDLREAVEHAVAEFDFERAAQLLLDFHARQNHA
jgi:PAS domain S-box-containing protein